jgi:Tetratricopeptide repeat
VRNPGDMPPDSPYDAAELAAGAAEVVRQRRELAAADPARMPDLASALTNLGVRYGRMGRRDEAVAQTEEAIQLRRQLAAANPAFTPGLAGAHRCHPDLVPPPPRTSATASRLLASAPAPYADPVNWAAFTYWGA